jgi:alpha-mannosidase
LGGSAHWKADGWKYHDGDLSHGEEPNLDDSSWQTTGRLNKASTGVIWLRRWFEMPKDLNGYDLAGTRIWLQFRVDGNIRPWEIQTIRVSYSPSEPAQTAGIPRI